MSQVEQDPTLYWIREAAASMGGTAHPEANTIPEATAHASGTVAVSNTMPEAAFETPPDRPAPTDTPPPDAPKGPVLTSTEGGTRHEELQEMRRIGICRGFVSMDGMREGDEVVLDLGTNPIEENVATCRVYGIVEGTVDHPDESGGAPGIVLTVKADEERTNSESFHNGPITAGSRIVLYGTALSSNGHMRPDDRGRVVRNQTPVITMDGERVQQTTSSRRRPDGRHLELQEVTVNGVTMFTDEE